MADLALAEKIAAFMNELLEIDPEAVHTLTAFVCPCSDALAEHPTIQVTDDGFGGSSLRWIGLLNGLCGVKADRTGLLAEVYSDQDILTGFTVLRE